MAFIKRVKRKDSKGKTSETLYIIDQYIDENGKKRQDVLKKLGRLGLNIDMRGAKLELAKYNSEKVISRSDLSFGQAIEEFEGYYKGQIGQTIKQRTYESHLYEIQQLSELFNIKLNKLDFGTIEKWKSHEFQVGRLSNRTINRCLMAMRKVLRFCIRNGYLDKMPDWDMLKNKKSNPEAHTLEEVNQMLEASNTNECMNRYLRLMLSTGIRPQEATALMPEDIDSKKITLKIRSDNDLKRGRVIPLEKDFCEELLEWVKETGRVCPYETTTGAQSVLSRLAKRLGFQSAPKKLRSTYASLMVQEDANPFRLAELMGNSVKVLEQYYIAHNIKKLAEEAKLNPVLSSIKNVKAEQKRNE